MQAIRNKLTGKSKRSNRKSMNMDQSSQNLAAPMATQQPLNPTPSEPGAIVTEFNESHRDLPSGTHFYHYEKTEVLPSSFSSSSIPVPPPMPPANFYDNMDTSKYDVYFRNLDTSSSGSFAMDSFPSQSVRSLEVLPVEVIEKPVVIHESIRQEQVEEIQPVVRVEREKTEIRQITQPLTDKEVRPVLIEERTLPVEVLPTIVGQAVPAPERFDQSTRDFDATLRQVVEKTPIIQETEKWRIIEEIQPIIYREVVVPHVIRTSRPMREVIVESPIFTEQVLSSRQLTAEERMRWSSFFSKETILREAMPMTSVPMSSIAEPTVVRVVQESAPVVAPLHKKEVLEEVITTTTTTTTAPIVGATRSNLVAGNNSSTSNLSGAPAVLNESHDVKLGPNGETITRDSLTTTSSSVLPTRAN